MVVSLLLNHVCCHRPKVFTANNNVPYETNHARYFERHEILKNLYLLNEII